MAVAAIVVFAVLTVATVCWMLMNRKHPETAASHREGSLRATPSEPDHNPAGPGAEPQRVTVRGHVVPGLRQRSP